MTLFDILIRWELLCKRHRDAVGYQRSVDGAEAEKDVDVEALPGQFIKEMWLLSISLAWLGFLCAYQ
jgi:hypothetical protein